MRLYEKNEVHIRVNGEWIHFGTKCENNLQENKYLTLKEIGEILNITRERVRQIEKKAIMKLKNHFKEYKDIL